MKFDAKTLFAQNAQEFADAAGIPESSNAFYENHISPAVEKDYRRGRDLEAGYLAAISDYQRDGFIIGFKAAVQLLTSCMASGTIVRE